MASLRKRNNLWQAQVRIKNSGSISKSFNLRKDALIWATTQENLMQRGEWEKDTQPKKSLYDLMNRYLDKVTPNKRGRCTEERRLKRLLKDDEFLKLKLSQIKPCDVASFRDKRVNDGVRACQYDLVLMRHAWNVATLEWGWRLNENPFKLVKYPKSNPPRERRLRKGEYELLKSKLSQRGSWYLWPMIEIAIETGMRKSEILSLTWESVDFESREIFLQQTKSGYSRWITLTNKALSVLKDMPNKENHIFPVTENAVRQSWERLRNRAGLNDLNFHDLRHEAISRFFEMGLTAPEVASISGHRTLNQLFRYSHANLERIKDKFN